MIHGKRQRTNELERQARKITFFIDPTYSFKKLLSLRSSLTRNLRREIAASSLPQWRWSEQFVWVQQGVLFAHHSARYISSSIFSWSQEWKSWQDKQWHCMRWGSELFSARLLHPFSNDSFRFSFLSLLSSGDCCLPMSLSRRRQLDPSKLVIFSPKHTLARSPGVAVSNTASEQGISSPRSPPMAESLEANKWASACNLNWLCEPAPRFPRLLLPRALRMPRDANNKSMHQAALVRRTCFHSL